MGSLWHGYHLNSSILLWNGFGRANSKQKTLIVLNKPTLYMDNNVQTYKYLRFLSVLFCSACSIWEALISVPITWLKYGTRNFVLCPLPQPTSYASSNGPLYYIKWQKITLNNFFNIFNRQFTFSWRNVIILLIKSDGGTVRYLAYNRAWAFPSK
jgi:hypothetical protein